jgi:hypothetical protein
MFKALRQFFCRHECSIWDLQSSGPPTDPDRIVWANCEKCGDRLEASHGLALPVVIWNQKRRPY